MKKITLQLEGMHCTSCAFNIDGELEDTIGISESKTNYAKQRAEVTFDSEKINPDEIISIIKKLDDRYDAKVLE